MKNSRVVIVLILTIAITGCCAKRYVNEEETCGLVLQEERIRIVEDGCSGSTPVFRCAGTCRSGILRPRTYYDKMLAFTLSVYIIEVVYSSLVMF